MGYFCLCLFSFSFLFLISLCPSSHSPISPTPLHTSPLLSSLLICSLDLEVVGLCQWMCKRLQMAWMRSCSLFTPLSLPPQLERVNNSQASCHKDNVIFPPYAINRGLKLSTKEKKKDSVKNTADKFIRTYRKANSINVLPNRIVVVVWKERKRGKTQCSVVRRVSNREIYLSRTLWKKKGFYYSVWYNIILVHHL